MSESLNNEFCFLSRVKISWFYLSRSRGNHSYNAWALPKGTLKRRNYKTSNYWPHIFRRFWGLGVYLSLPDELDKTAKIAHKQKWDKCKWGGYDRAYPTCMKISQQNDKLS